MKDDSSKAIVHCSVIIYYRIQINPEAAAVWSDKSFDKLKPSWLPGTEPVPIIDCEKINGEYRARDSNMFNSVCFQNWLARRSGWGSSSQLLLTDYNQSWWCVLWRYIEKEWFLVAWLLLGLGLLEDFYVLKLLQPVISFWEKTPSLNAVFRVYSFLITPLCLYITSI